MGEYYLNVQELAAKLGAKILTGPAGNPSSGAAERTAETGPDSGGTSGFADVNGIYCGDLLSWVMSHAQKGSAWITVHTHLNIVAVAVLSELSCIIIPEGIEVEEATVKKAAREGITILSSNLSAYGICSIAHECGI